MLVMPCSAALATEIAIPCRSEYRQHASLSFEVNAAKANALRVFKYLGAKELRVGLWVLRSIGCESSMLQASLETQSFGMAWRRKYTAIL